MVIIEIIIMKKAIVILTRRRLFSVFRQNTGNQL